MGFIASLLRQGPLPLFERTQCKLVRTTIRSNWKGLVKTRMPKVNKKTLGSGWLKNNNPPGNPDSAPRCGARTRNQTKCQAPAMANGRCRMHGGASTGPRTPKGLARSRKANWKTAQTARAGVRRLPAKGTRRGRRAFGPHTGTLYSTWRVTRKESCNEAQHSTTRRGVRPSAKLLDDVVLVVNVIRCPEWP